MAKLFDINKGRVEMNPASLWIPEFKKLWDRDKSKTKENAVKDITYIVFLNAFDSPYQAYSYDERKIKLKEGYYTPSWEPDDEIKKAEKKFLELQDTPSLKMLRSVKEGIEKIESYFRNASPDNATEIIKNAKEMGSLVKSLDALEKQVQKEKLESASIRGGQEIGLFEL